jgi:hypothetical protein
MTSLLRLFNSGDSQGGSTMKGTGSIPTLSFDELQAAVSGSTAAIRAITRLAPAGGAGDKVFPPTYATGDRATTRYAWENRRLDGADVKTVLLDSVASQANRIERLTTESMFERVGARGGLAIARKARCC